ncbi:MAG: alanine racemase [Bacillota bacterium]
MNSLYNFLDTPSLLIDLDQTKRNIKMMQKKTENLGISLTPHTKTHKMPYFAKMQIKEGARGIAVAKIGEAEVMAEHGIDNIFIANEIIGISKYKRIKKLNKKINISVGVDNRVQIDQIQKVFSNEKEALEVLIEYEVGENRTGVITDEQLIDLVNYIKEKKKVKLKGIFSHEGHTYKAKNRNLAKKLAEKSYRKSIEAANIIKNMGIDIDTISVGATPSVMNGAYVEGITDFRVGTYIFMDLGQAKAIGSFEKCAATILATVISKPTKNRVVLDAGAKALVPQNRDSGICSTNGYGYVKDSDNVYLTRLFDEHGIINDKNFQNEVSIGDKIEIIPAHICPTVNLYDEAQVVANGKLIKKVPILARGKTK